MGLVNGARQAAKSTLTRLAAQDRPGTVVRLLDDAATLRAAQADPAGFVEHDGLMVIDEVQLAPGLLRAIKVLVDTDPRPGRFLLTGSSRVLALRSLPDALPGRMEVIELWPFSQGEVHGRRPVHRRGFQARRRHRALVAAAQARLPGTGRGRRFPEAARRTPGRRAAFFASYLSTLIERDVLEVSSIERQGDMHRLLALLAGRVSGLLVPNTLAGQSGIPRTTLVRYLELLATVFLIKPVPGLVQRAGDQGRRHPEGRPAAARDVTRSAGSASLTGGPIARSQIEIADPGHMPAQRSARGRSSRAAGT